MARSPDPIGTRLRAVLDHVELVDNVAELAAVLHRIVDSDPALPTTLDLIGHTTPGSLLMLGDTVLDGGDPAVLAIFGALGSSRVLARLGVTSLRLLGCNTASGDAARATLCALADLLGVEVYGSTSAIFVEHYDRTGFRDDWRFLLVGSTELRPERSRTVFGRARAFDVASLPAFVPDDAVCVTCAAAAKLAELVGGDAGAGMIARIEPDLRLAVPSSAATYHLVEVLLGGAFVRVYYDGPAEPATVFPVTDPVALARLVTDSMRSARRFRST